MKPGPRIWASNPLWIGGPDAGVASKVPASTGQLADGYYRNLRVSPQIWNFEEWAQALKLHHTAAMRMLNPMNVDITAAIAGLPWVGGPADGCHDQAAMTDTILTGSNVPAPFNIEEGIAVGCLSWNATVVGAPMAQAYPRIAVHATNSSRGAVVRAGLALGADVIASLGYAGWAAWPGGTPGAGTWTSITRSPSAWIIGASVGPAPGQWVQYAATTAAAFAVPGVAPLFGTPVTCLHASNHVAADVYPSDPGNNVVLALSAGWQSLGNAAGTTWSAVALHWLPAAPLDLAYSKCGTKWMAPLANGTLSYSTDNGVTWTNLPIGSLMAAPTTARIACDGFGDWMLAMTDGATVEAWSSYDDGVTWYRVFALPTLVVNHIALWYGGGRFHLYTATGAGGAGSGILWETMRAGE